MSPGGAAGIDVVVVAYGAPRRLARCLAALEGRFPVLVVDNSSSPAVADVARGAGARYVDPGANLGFGAAVNVGLGDWEARHGARARSGGDGARSGGGDPPDAKDVRDVPDVLLLNPDATVDPDALAALQHALHAEPRLACVAPAQHAPGSEAPVRARWPWHTPAGAWAEALGLARVRLDSSRYFVGGSVLLLRADALADVGPFDERFFLYSEDEDWQHRARRRRWSVRYCPHVAATHGGGGTEPDRARLQLRLHAGLERYVRKWYGTGGWALFRAGTLVGLALRVVLRRGARRSAAATLARIYLTGPDRAARRARAVPAPGSPLSDR